MGQLDFSKVDDLFDKPTAEKFIQRRKERGLLITVEDGEQRIDLGDHQAVIQRLTWKEIQPCGHVGVDRRCESRIAGLQDKLQDHMKTAEKIWSTEIEGACAEKAVSKFRGLEWDETVGKFQRGGDVGNWTQVRHTLDNQGSLKYRSWTCENKPYVCVTGELGWYLLHGWIWGFKAKQRPVSWPTNNPAWVVFQKDLEPMDTLPPEPEFEVGKKVSDELLCRIMNWSPEYLAEEKRWDH